jgi:tellurite resistance protein
MGLFDKVFGKETTPAANQALTLPEAFLGIALAVAAADGHISQSEVEGIISYLRRMQMFQGFNGQQFSNMFDKLLVIVKRQGPSGLVKLAKEVLSRELRETAFACAVDIALADGSIEESEQSLLSEMQQVLEIPENIAVTVIQVMIIKNRG